MAGWDPTALFVILIIVNMVILVRGYIMILTVLRSVTGHFEENGGAKFLIAHNALNNISDFLESRYEALSANEQRGRIVEMIGDYSKKMDNLMESKNAADKKGT